MSEMSMEITGNFKQCETCKGPLLFLSNEKGGMDLATEVILITRRGQNYYQVHTDTCEFKGTFKRPWVWDIEDDR